MIGERLGEFEMYVGYLTVTFGVSRPANRPISIWQDRQLVAELDSTQVDRPYPRVRWRDATYRTMTPEWREHFTRSVVRIWRDHRAPTVDLSGREVSS